MNIFLARQPIYDNKREIVAYELLYRNSSVNKYMGGISEDNATIQLISNTASIGLENLTNKKRAFINFSEDTLLKDVASLLHKDGVVIEVLESVKPTEEIVSYLRKLKNKGYLIALDDVGIESSYKDFGDLIDIYKIDFMITSKRQRDILLRILRKHNSKAKFLAEKIETDEEYEEAKKNGYDYYQGFYFSEPLMVLGKDVLINNTTCFNVMSQIRKDDIDLDDVEQIMKVDMSLTYKLLKFLNSSIFSFVQPISSVKQAIMLLGSKELKKWLYLVVLGSMKSENGEDSVYNTIIRSRFCELIAEKVAPEMKSAAFLTGLFSNLDNFVGQTMEEICSELPIDINIKEALLGKNNKLKEILDLVKAYEKNEFNKVDRYSKILNIDTDVLVNCYIYSLDWTSQVVGYV